MHVGDIKFAIQKRLPLQAWHVDRTYIKVRINMLGTLPVASKQFKHCCGQIHRRGFVHHA